MNDELRKHIQAIAKSIEQTKNSGTPRLNALQEAVLFILRAFETAENGGGSHYERIYAEVMAKGPDYVPNFEEILALDNHDEPEEPTPAAVDPDHTFVKLGDAADAVVKTSVQRACEGAGWELIGEDDNGFAFQLRDKDTVTYYSKAAMEQNAWADLYDYVQREQGVVPHTGRVVEPDDTIPERAILNLAKHLTAHAAVDWDDLDENVRLFYAGRALFILEGSK